MKDIKRQLPKGWKWGEDWQSYCPGSVWISVWRKIKERRLPALTHEQYFK